MSRGMIAILVLVLGSIGALQSMFIVTQVEQALVVRFGQIIREIREPGLAFKVPFIDDVVYFDNRLLEFNAPPQEFITKDRNADVEERVVIDAFVRYRIVDPINFYQAVRNEANLESRLSSIVIANMRKIIARNSLSDLLSNKRTEIMRAIQQAVNKQATSEVVAVPEEAVADEVLEANPEVVSEELVKEAEKLNEAPRRLRQGFGIEIIDVRIMRADLPSDISQSTYERMRKNFTKEAQRFRAEGEERALEIRSTAERERVEIMAQAKKESETLRGQGDGIASKIYADAFGRDADFFEFYRSMQAYRKSLKQEDTTLILSPDSEFLKALE